jgi:hypothetical protein
VNISIVSSADRLRETDAAMTEPDDGGPTIGYSIEAKPTRETRM